MNFNDVRFACECHKMKLLFVSLLLYVLHRNFAEHPLISYALLGLFAGPLFDYGLLTVLMLSIIAFKCRYRWEREGAEFAVRVVMIVLFTASVSLLFRILLSNNGPNERHEQAMGNNVVLLSLTESKIHDASTFLSCALKLSNLYVFCMSFYALQLTYAVI